MVICRIRHAVLREDGADALHPTTLAASREALHDSWIVAWYETVSLGPRLCDGSAPLRWVATSGWTVVLKVVVEIRDVAQKGYSASRRRRDDRLAARRVDSQVQGGEAREDLLITH